MIDNYRQVIISNFGDDFVEEPSTHDLRYQCPHCKEQGKTYDDYKLYVSYRTLIFHCFRCDWKGKLSTDDLYSEGTANQFVNALNKFKQANTADADDLETLYKLPSIVPIDSDPAVIYLNKRGISYDDILYYNMRVTGAGDPFRFWGRIVIPNRLISKQWTDMYSARAYIALEPKYLNPKNSPRAKTVFNLHKIPNGAPQIIITEGVLTAIAAGRDAVATYGKSVTEDQIAQIIQKRPERIYVSLDNDAEPQKGVYKDPTRYKIDNLVKRLLELSNIPIYLVQLPPGLDAVDVGRDIYRGQYLSSAKQVRNIREYELYIAIT